MTSVCVVTPTYNEKNNLPALVERVFNLGIPHLEMLVVDDNSPDGTGAIADMLSRTYPVRVLHREKKEGFGRAYAAAFHYLLNSEKKPDVIIHLDADLSHDTLVIPTMLTLIKEYDIVLGSRYIPGGKIINLSFKRRMISRLANTYTRVVLNMPYRDMTSGFKCYQRHALEGIIASGLDSVGYCFLTETTYKAHQKGYKIKEVPISFTMRRGGKSKMSMSVIVESFFKVLSLRFSR